MNTTASDDFEIIPDRNDNSIPLGDVRLSWKCNVRTTRRQSRTASGAYWARRSEEIAEQQDLFDFENARSEGLENCATYWEWCVTVISIDKIDFAAE